MKTFRILLVDLVVTTMLSMSSCGPKPVHLPELPLERVTPYFSQAAEVQTIDTSYFQVKDAEGKFLGTLLFSTPYADLIRGYNGATPLVIALDAENRITKVVLLPNHETPRFAERVEQGGLYQAWDGLTVEEALDKEVDAISGATYTSTGVKNTLTARLQAYQRQLTKDYNAKPNFWQRVFGKFAK